MDEAFRHLNIQKEKKGDQNVRYIDARSHPCIAVLKTPQPRPHTGNARRLVAMNVCTALSSTYFLEKKKGRDKKKKRLLARRNEHASSLGVVVPSARSCFTAVLLGVPFDPLLEFGSEVSD